MQQVLPPTEHFTYWLLVSEAFSRDVMNLTSLRLCQIGVGIGSVKADIPCDVKHMQITEERQLSKSNMLK
jgi:hypothetical protein